MIVFIMLALRLLLLSCPISVFALFLVSLWLTSHIEVFIRLMSSHPSMAIISPASKILSASLLLPLNSRSFP